MEAFTGYLLKSTMYISGFALIYFLFLRNERFFVLKRIYLLSGILVSFLFPFISIHYQVELPAPDLTSTGVTGAGFLVPAEIGQSSPENKPDYGLILMLVYLAGIVFLFLRLMVHIGSIMKTIHNNKINCLNDAKVVRAEGYPASFSFFNYVFISPSVDESEAEEIMNHELVHIHQKHWFDLVLVETLRMVQWVNPFAWIYTGFIRLNHEFLADEAALKRTSNQAKYRAALINQLFRSPVFSLTNSFSYSLNKKRFDMMKKIVTSPYRKMRVLFVLPVFAIVLYSFATPEYNYTASADNYLSISQSPVIQDNEVRGIVLNEEGKPFPGVHIKVSGTSVTATTDNKGNFSLGKVSGKPAIIFYYVGYITLAIEAEYDPGMIVKMTKDPDYKAYLDRQPIIVIDDVITTKSRNEVMIEVGNQIGTYKVLTVQDATEKYGEKGKYGAMEIVTRKRAEELGIKIPFRRQNPEDFPTFMGKSHTTFYDWVVGQLKYPDDAKTQGREGIVQVSFSVEMDGSVTNVKSSASTIDKSLTDAVIKIINSSPKWEPAKNPKADEPFITSVSVRFRLPDKVGGYSPFVVVEQMPRFPGGDAELLKFIAGNTQYPDSAKAAGIQGRVIVRFVVTSEGDTEAASVLKGVHPLLDEEALRVISLLKGFTPGYQGGKAVDVWYMVPITFTLK